jgi:hypothetical protein
MAANSCLSIKDFGRSGGANGDSIMAFSASMSVKEIGSGASQSPMLIAAVLQELLRTISLLSF